MNMLDLVNYSVTGRNQRYFDCSFLIDINNNEARVYGASVCYRDILLYTDIGTATYVVDSYGDRHVAELFDWDYDSDEVNHERV